MARAAHSGSAKGVYGKRVGRWAICGIAGLLGCLLVLGLSACSNTASGARFTDKVYHFSFKIPAGWTPPKGGVKQNTPIGTEYVVAFVKPPGFRVVVRSPMPLLNKVPNGRVLHHPKGDCPGTCVFYRIHVSGLPAVYVRQTLHGGRQLLEEDVDLNSHANGYEIKLAGVPGVTTRQSAQFAKVIKSFKIGPHG